MPGIDEVISGAASDDVFLAALSANHEARLLESIRTLRDNISGMLNKLETTPAGKLIGVKTNLKQAQKIHKQLVNQFEKDYNVKVNRMLGDFKHIDKTIKRRYKALNESIEFAGIDKAMMNALKSNTYQRYKEFGDDARNRIASAMYNSVAGGAKFSTLVNTVKGILTGRKDVRGRPMTMYAKGFAQDAVMNYHNQVNTKKAEDLGMKHFLYYGDVIATSRPFCITRVGKVYNKRQIGAWDSISWKGKAGPAFTDRGGYNCRHHWRGVRKEWMQDEIGDIDRNEIIARMSPQTSGVSKLTEEIKVKKQSLVTAKGRVTRSKKKQYLYKVLKKEGKATAKDKKAYLLERKFMREQESLVDKFTEELKALKDKLEGKGKIIIKKRKIAVAKPKVKLKPPVIKPKKPPVVIKPKVKPKPPVVKVEAKGVPVLDKKVKSFVGKVKYYVKGGKSVGENSKMFYYWNRLEDWEKNYYLDLWESQGINTFSYRHLFPWEEIEIPKIKLKPPVVKVEAKPPTKKVVSLAEEKEARKVKVIEVRKEALESELSGNGLNLNNNAGWEDEFWVNNILDPLSDEMDRINNLSPLIQEGLDNVPIGVDIYRGESLVEIGFEEAEGLYQGRYDRVSVATRRNFSFQTKESNLSFGRDVYTMSVEAGSPQCIFRHELGHHVQKILNYHPQWEEMQLAGIWNDIWITRGNFFFKDYVSDYAGDTMQEAFAETFASYFSSRYKRGMLPEVLENFMDQLSTGIRGGYNYALDQKTFQTAAEVMAQKVGNQQVFMSAKRMTALQKIKADGGYTRKGKNWYFGKKKVSTGISKRLDKMGIPPAWTNVIVAKKKTARVQAMGRDIAGRWQYRFLVKSTEESAKKNFARIRKFDSDMPKIRKKISAGMKKNDARAFLLDIENKTVIRIGTDRDLGAKVKAFGLTTLQHEHVVIRGNRIIFDFTAKEGVHAHYELTDSRLASWLKKRKAKTRKGQKLFPDVTAKKLNDYIKEISKKSYTAKDFRTYHGTRIAYEELKKYAGKVLDIKEKKRIIKEVSEMVSEFLHNTPAMAKKSYIDPVVWDLIGGL